MFEKLDTPVWIESVLGEFDPAQASRYRSRSDYLDRSFAGIKDENKMNALRLMVNLGVPPDDVSSVLGILYGHILAAAEEIPKQIRQASADVNTTVEKFTRESMTFQEVIAGTQKVVYKDVYDRCMDLSQGAVRAASEKGLEEHQFRMRAATESALKQFLENAVRERQKIGSDVRILQHRLITAVAAVVVIAAGWAGGATWGIDHGHAPPAVQRDAQYGQQFIQMYGEMPESMQSWIKKWTARHSG